jgi:peptidoglycan hydrolase CwlO-like protein
MNPEHDIDEYYNSLLERLEELEGDFKKVDDQLAKMVNEDKEQCTFFFICENMYHDLEQDIKELKKEIEEYDRS